MKASRNLPAGNTESVPIMDTFSRTFHFLHFSPTHLGFLTHFTTTTPPSQNAYFIETLLIICIQSQKSNPETLIIFAANNSNLLRWLSGKESTCQCRRPRFNPWVRKIPWRRKWQPTAVFLSGKSYEHRSLVGYSPCGCKRVGQDSAPKQQQHRLKQHLQLLSD